MPSVRDSYAFTLSFLVRDYECDMEGIVNNAIYQNYLEHARHQYLKEMGIEFAEITERGVYPVVIRAEIDYRSPLRSGDAFWVSVRIERLSRMKIAFVQDIFAEPRTDEADDAARPVANAKIITAAMNTAGRPVRPEHMHPLMTELLDSAGSA